jgi:hypothetical protein
MTVIAILAGLILSISGFANKKAALARAQAEIQALSTGCESYKADNGTYPHQPLATPSVSGTIPPVTGLNTSSSNIPSDLLDPRTNGNSTSNSGGTYISASLELYEALTGDVSCTGTGGGAGVKNYISDIRQDAFGRSNPTAVVSSSNPVLYLSDPFGNCYGYSTANASAVSSGVTGISNYNPPTTNPGFNPTYDLWSTGGNLNSPFSGTGTSAPGAPGDPMLQWIKNW